MMNDDRGVATMYTAMALSALLAVTVLVLQVGAVTVARHRAQASADLAALAGASTLQDGSRAACSAAREISDRMRTILSECLIDEWDVLVTINLRMTFGLGAPATVVAVARAGPDQDRVH